MAESYQSALAGYPRFPLIAGPSPLQRASRLEAALKHEGIEVPRLYLKRDDLVSLAMGGNKLRNLEFLIGDALAHRATAIVTGGRAQSNHCRLTAAACVKAGLTAHLVLSGEEPRAWTGNLLLDRMFGAEIAFTGTDDRVVRDEMMKTAADRIRASGGVPYVIPVGGSDTRGAFGHVLAAAELHAQLELAGERRASLVLATATGGTQAGMLVGLGALAGQVDVTAFAVAKSAEELAPQVQRLAAEAAAALGVGMPAAADIRIDGTALGGGYGVETVEARAAIAFLARTEAVLADPVYTGKALAGLLARIRGRAYRADEAVVFLHTGGTAALFSA